jgi:transcriptional regulator with XRE-family HTH domain
MNYGKKLNELIKTHDLSLAYLCKRLEVSRYMLNKNLKTGNFKQYQKQLIDKLEKGLSYVA